jgi:two-component system phosphate regulon response regulator PhoB
MSARILVVEDEEALTTL